jgi:hypothetical protein
MSLLLCIYLCVPLWFYLVFPLFQIIRYFDFSRYIVFAMHLNIHYVRIHSKSNIFRKTKTSYNMEWREYQPIFITLILFAYLLLCIIVLSILLSWTLKMVTCVIVSDLIYRSWLLPTCIRPHYIIVDMPNFSFPFSRLASQVLFMFLHRNMKN